ncbi:MAG: nucleotidyltransferase domain-containing protein [Prevotella sp.]|nr:nucleotidyltransferase domain-containing protein [Prevotella sp.]
MEQQEVISKIKNVAMKTLPPRSSLFLYGSRARGDAHANSDWDLLILLDKQSLEAADYGVAYPFRELGWEIGEDLNPSLYTKKQWSSWSFLPYYKNVERDKIVLL